MHEIYCAINDHKFIVHAHTDLGADERYIFVCLIRRRHCKTLSILVRIQEIPTTTVSIPGGIAVTPRGLNNTYVDLLLSDAFNQNL